MTDRDLSRFVAFIGALEELGRYKQLLRLHGPDSPHRPIIEQDIKNQERVAFLAFGEAVREAELEAINRDINEIQEPLR